jgi:ribosomal protein S15P/S13E
MTDHDPGYVAGLATQLGDRHPHLLATAEQDLAILRSRLAIVATWIHNPTHDHTARRALAQALGLPEPTQPRPQ